MIKICISVTSLALDPSPLSQTVTPSRTPSPFERDVLYGRPLEPSVQHRDSHCAISIQKSLQHISLKTCFAPPSFIKSMNCSRIELSSEVRSLMESANGLLMNR